MATITSVLILSADTGGGHRSAARALQESLQQSSTPARTVQVTISRALEEASGPSRWMGDLYNWLLRHHQDWMQYYYQLLNHLRPNESRLLFLLAREYGQRLLEQTRPNVIVSVHPMTHHFFAHLLRELGWLDKIPLVVVVTDPGYGFWRGWACSEVQRYYVASQGAQRQLLDYGVAPERIQMMGLPVRACFQPLPLEQQRQLRCAYGLDPDKLTLLVNAGWIGGGNIPRILRSLLKSQVAGVQVVFLAGKNEGLRRQALQWAAQSSIPLTVVGFTPDIHELMQIADVMVSKLGGLTAFEALATELPILVDTVTPPMPQEAGTVRWLHESGSGMLLEHPEQILAVVESLLGVPELLPKLKQATRSSQQRGAAEGIARDILHLA